MSRPKTGSSWTARCVMVSETSAFSDLSSGASAVTLTVSPTVPTARRALIEVTASTSTCTFFGVYAEKPGASTRTS